MINRIKKYPLHFALLASLLLHVGAYFFTGMGLRFLRLFQLVPAVASVPEEKPKQPLVFEVMETPNSAQREQPPENAKHASDKNAISLNLEAPRGLPTGADVFNVELPSNSSSAFSQSESQKQTSDFSSALDFNGASFSRDFLTQKKPTSPLEASIQLARGTPSSRIGNFSLNTYQWNFYPFVKAFNKKIKEHWRLPPAFTEMDLIHGKTTLRFKIFRDGGLHDLEVLQHGGHESLKEASKRAIEFSTPFQALPPEFPKDFLEITVEFDYNKFNSPDTKE